MLQSTHHWLIILSWKLQASFSIKGLQAIHWIIDIPVYFYTRFLSFFTPFDVNVGYEFRTATLISRSLFVVLYSYHWFPRFIASSSQLITTICWHWSHTLLQPCIAFIYFITLLDIDVLLGKCLSVPSLYSTLFCRLVVGCCKCCGGRCATQDSTRQETLSLDFGGATCRPLLLVQPRPPLERRALSCCNCWTQWWSLRRDSERHSSLEVYGAMKIGVALLSRIL